MKILKEIGSWIGSIVMAVVLAMGISIFLVQPTQVQGSSMENTFHTRDRILINKMYHTTKQTPQHGDVVVIDSRVDRPRTFQDDIIDTAQYNLLTKLMSQKPDEEIFWIKRVIGEPGDTIEIKNGQVYRNDALLEESYIKEPMNNRNNMKVVVPDDSVFVMGDNRNNSMDSRYIGCVPIDHVIGKFFYKF